MGRSAFSFTTFDFHKVMARCRLPERVDLREVCVGDGLCLDALGRVDDRDWLILTESGGRIRGIPMPFAVETVAREAWFETGAQR